MTQRDDRKLRQLCRQVQRALSFAVAEIDHDALIGAYIEDVRPFPNSGHLLVHVSVENASDDAERVLAQHAARLRTEVAHAISRRKAPELAFQILPRTAME